MLEMDKGGTKFLQSSWFTIYVNSFSFGFKHLFQADQPKEEGPQLENCLLSLSSLQRL